MKTVVEENKIRYPFEEIKNILYKQAHRIQKIFPNRCELDELVNEVWIKGDIQKLTNCKYISRRAFFDMMDYIRKQYGRNVMRNNVIKNRPKEDTNMHGFGHSPNEHESYDFFETIKDHRRGDVSRIEDKDQVKYILSCLPEIESKVLRKYYLEELTLKEIGKKFKLSESRISAIRKEALQLTAISAKLLRSNPGILENQRKNNSFNGQIFRRDLPSEEKMEDILPEYVSDFEIGNKYATDEEFILERDWSQENG